MLDVKAWDNKEHIELTGANNKFVLQNLDFLKHINKLYEVRIVITNNILNNKLTVTKVSEKISKSNIIYKIIKYRSIGVRHKEAKNLVEPNKEELEDLLNISKEIGVNNVYII